MLCLMVDIMSEASRLHASVLLLRYCVVRQNAHSCVMMIVCDSQVIGPLGVQLQIGLYSASLGTWNLVDCWVCSCRSDFIQPALGGLGGQLVSLCMFEFLLWNRLTHRY